MLRKAAYRDLNMKSDSKKAVRPQPFYKSYIIQGENRFLLFLLLSLSLFMISCGGAVNPENLYGEWKYIGVESPKNPEEGLTAEELKIENPSIIFSKDGGLIIMWGGKELSNGKFHIEGKLIRYTENLAGGKTRNFPFLIKKLTGKDLIFETMEQQPTRITARKIVPSAQ